MSSTRSAIIATASMRLNLEGPPGPIPGSPDGDMDALMMYLGRGAQAEDFAYLLPNFMSIWGDFPDGFDPDFPEDYLERMGRGAKAQFVAWVKDQVLPRLRGVDPLSLPANAFYSMPRRLPPETWLVHFSDNADSIAIEGFLFGEPDMARLHLTTWKTDEDRHRVPGWNFGFPAYSRNASSVEAAELYGVDAVMFQAPCVVALHDGDDEWQAIFWGPSVKQIVMLDRKGEGRWSVLHAKTGRSMRTGTFDQITLWVQENMDRKGVLGAVHPNLREQPSED